MSSKFTSDVPESVKDTCYEVDGVIVPIFMPLRALNKVRNFTCRPDDLFIVTYPKSGTTWAEQVSMLIRHDGDSNKLNDSHIMMKIPFIEIVLDPKDYENSPLMVDMAADMPSPRILKSHCHPPFLPLDISTEDPTAKVLYVARNPKDAAVSYFHFCHYIPGLPKYESWDVFFEEFLAGRTPQGSWFENVLPWWKVRDHPNVLFLKYEDMKKDLPKAVRQVADFMGKTLSDDVIEKVVSGSTFQAMKTNPSSNPDFLFKEVYADVPEAKESIGKTRSFMRKGIVGDWKNYFTEDQNERFDELYENELAGTGLQMDFE